MKTKKRKLRPTENYLKFSNLGGDTVYEWWFVVIHLSLIIGFSSFFYSEKVWLGFGLISVLGGLFWITSVLPLAFANKEMYLHEMKLLRRYEAWKAIREIKKTKKFDIYGHDEFNLSQGNEKYLKT